MTFSGWVTQWNLKTRKGVVLPDGIRNGRTRFSTKSLRMIKAKKICTGMRVGFELRVARNGVVKATDLVEVVEQ